MTLSQQNTISNEITCEAYGCSASAEEEITVPVGQSGEIHLSVCSNCRPKFGHDELDVNQEKIRFRKTQTLNQVGRRKLLRVLPISAQNRARSLI